MGHLDELSKSVSSKCDLTQKVKLRLDFTISMDGRKQRLSDVCASEYRPICISKSALSMLYHYIYRRLHNAPYYSYLYMQVNVIFIQC